MEKATLIITESPAKLKAWNGLRVAGGLIGEHMQVYVFLMDDGVYCAMKGQKPPKGLEQLDQAQRISELMELGATIKACSICTDARGITQDDLIPGVPIASLVDLAKDIKESKHVLTF